MGLVSMESDTYPYERVMSGAARYDGADQIPIKIVRYLLDLPDQHGYVPKDDNSRPRVRLAKYLWHDGDNPLSKPLPTHQEKLSMLFDGEEPDINTDEQKAKHPKGYRIFPQMYWGQTEMTAKVSLKCFIGRVVPTSEFSARIGLVFQVIVNVNLENTTRTEDAYSRAYAIETALISALHGVNIAGIGTIGFARLALADSGSTPFHDNGTHVGRELHLYVEWADGGNDCKTIEGCC